LESVRSVEEISRDPKEKSCVSAGGSDGNVLSRASSRYLCTMAIKEGRLARPDQCSSCGVVGQKVIPHHENYQKPLDVVWLCENCHAKLHGKLRSAGKIVDSETPVVGRKESKPSVTAIMFEVHSQIKSDFDEAWKSEGYATFSEALRSLMRRFINRWKRSYGRQMQSQGMPGAGGNGISEETVMPEALGMVLQGNGTQQVAPERSTMPQD
jgi:hypothetical protein